LKTIAILAYPGAGKTWTVEKFYEYLVPKIAASVGQPVEIAEQALIITSKVGLVEYHDFLEIAIVGRYDGSTFQGTDRLSMAVAPDFGPFFEQMKAEGKKLVVAEGDRINCMPFFKAALAAGQLERIKLDTPPGILKERRNKRGTNQPQKFLNAVASKVDKHSFDLVFRDNEELLKHLIRQS